MLVVPPVRVHVVAQLQLDLWVQGRQVLDERSHGHSLDAVHSLDALHPSSSISFRRSWYSVMSSIIAARTERHGWQPEVAPRFTFSSGRFRSRTSASVSSIATLL